MQNCLCASPHGAARLLARHLVTLSPCTVTPSSFRSTPLLLSGSCTSHPTAWLQPVPCCHPSAGPVGIFLHLQWWFPTAALHSETADWWSGRGRTGAPCTVRPEEAQGAQQTTPNSPDLAYSNLPSGSPQKSGGKDNMMVTAKEESQQAVRLKELSGSCKVLLLLN